VRGQRSGVRAGERQRRAQRCVCGAQRELFCRVDTVTSPLPAALPPSAALGVRCFSAFATSSPFSPSRLHAAPRARCKKDSLSPFCRLFLPATLFSPPERVRESARASKEALIFFVTDTRRRARCPRRILVSRHFLRPSPRCLLFFFFFFFLLDSCATFLRADIGAMLPMPPCLLLSPLRHGARLRFSRRVITPSVTARRFIMPQKRQ